MRKKSSPIGVQFCRDPSCPYLYSVVKEMCEFFITNCSYSDIVLSHLNFNKQNPKNVILHALKIWLKRATNIISNSHSGPVGIV